MKTLKNISTVPTELFDIIRRLHSTYHKRNCYNARADVHNLVVQAREIQKDSLATL